MLVRILLLPSAVLAAAFAVAGLPGLAAAQETASTCDVLVLAGRAHGVAADAGGAFVAWSGGRIVAAGPASAAQRWKAERTLALPRALIAPGFVDAHGHLLSLGEALENVDLVGTRSYAEVIERVAERAAATPPGEWVVGRGWDQNDWKDTAFPHHRELSAAVPRHPVWIVRIDGHAALANSKAMEVAGIPARSEDPPGGRVLRDEQGLPTGVFVDRAMGQVRSKIGVQARPLEERLLAAQARLLEVGLTGIHDAGIEPATVAALEELLAAHRWKIRVYGMWSGRPQKDSPLAHPSGLLAVRAVKVYADGALGSRGAALLEDYADEPGVRGLETTSKEQLEAVYERCLAAGFQACTHAIGDRGNRNVLDAFEAACKRAGLDAEQRRSVRFRVEHAQVVSLADFDRWKALGLLASMQPTHCTSDMDWAIARIGEARARGAYAWRTMLEHSIPLSFGSDFPVEDCDPRFGVFAALTRTHADGTPSGGWFPAQRLSEAEAIDAFTAGAAYAAFAESHAGRIAPGFDADLTVFDPDPALTEAPAGWLATRAVLTVIGGEIAHERK